MSWHWDKTKQTKTHAGLKLVLVVQMWLFILSLLKSGKWGISQKARSSVSPEICCLYLESKVNSKAFFISTWSWADTHLVCTCDQNCLVWVQWCQIVLWFPHTDRVRAQMHQLWLSFAGAQQKTAPLRSGWIIWAARTTSRPRSTSGSTSTIAK